MSYTTNRLAALRKKREKNQDEVAEAVGISRSSLSNYESGRTPLTKLDIAIALAQYYDVSLDYIIGRSPVQHPSEKDTLSAQLNRLAMRSNGKTPTAERMATLVDRAMKYIDSTQPCGDAPLNALGKFIEALIYCLYDISENDVQSLIIHANAAVSGAFDISEAPALLMTNMKGDG